MDDSAIKAAVTFYMNLMKTAETKYATQSGETKSKWITKPNPLLETDALKILTGAIVGTPTPIILRPWKDKGLNYWACLSSPKVLLEKTKTLCAFLSDEEFHPILEQSNENLYTWLFWDTAQKACNILRLFKKACKAVDLPLATQGTKFSGTAAILLPSGFNGKGHHKPNRIMSRPLFASDPIDPTAVPYLIDPKSGEPIGEVYDPVQQLLFLENTLFLSKPISDLWEPSDRKNRKRRSQKSYKEITVDEIPLALEQDLDLGWMLESHCGVRSFRGNKAKCPIGNDHDLRLHFTFDNSLECLRASSWQCDLHGKGDALDLWTKKTGLTKQEATRYFADELGIGSNEVKGFNCCKPFFPNQDRSQGWSQDDAFTQCEEKVGNICSDLTTIGKAMLIRLPPGGGKTLATAKVIGSLFDEGKIVWVAPRHSIIDNKSFLEYLKDPQIFAGPSKGNCEFYEKVKQALDADVNYRDVVCANCPRNNLKYCLFRRQKLPRKNKNKIYQHAHLAFSDEPLKNADVIVIDESFIDTICLQPIRVSKRQLTNTIATLEPNSNCWKLLSGMLSILEQAVNNDDEYLIQEIIKHKEDSSYKDKSLYEHELAIGSTIYARLKHTLGQNPMGLLSNTKSMPKPTLKSNTINQENWDKICEIFRYELTKWESDEPFNSRCWLVRDSKQPGETAIGGEAFFTFTPVRQICIPSTSRLIILDATGNKEIYDRLVRRSDGNIEIEEWPPRETEYEIRPEVSVWQVTDKENSPSSYGKSNINGSQNSQESIANKIIRIIQFAQKYDYVPEEKSLRVLIASHQDASTRIMGYCEKLEERINQGQLKEDRLEYHFENIHYYGQRGENLWDGVPIVFVISVPDLSFTQLKMRASALYWDDPEPLDMDYEYNKTNGRYHFSDPKISSIHRLAREDELYQASGRIRYWKTENGKQLIVLMGHLPVPGLMPTLLVNRIPTNTKDKKKRVGSNKDKKLQTLL